MTAEKKKKVDEVLALQALINSKKNKFNKDGSVNGDYEQDGAYDDYRSQSDISQLKTQKTQAAAKSQVVLPEKARPLNKKEKLIL